MYSLVKMLDRSLEYVDHTILNDSFCINVVSIKTFTETLDFVGFKSKKTNRDIYQFLCPYRRCIVILLNG